MTILDAVPLRDQRSRLFSLGLRPCPLRTEIPPDSLNLLIMLCTVEGEISKSLPVFLWGTLFLNISIIFSHICWQTGDPRPIFAPKGLDLSWMLLYQIIITITCWHQLFQITSLFNQFTSLLALNCSCPNFFWNVLQVWMTGKDVYLQMTWSWPDKTWNILCSYCLQWNTSQSKFRNYYFLFLFAFSIPSQLFLIWGCTFAFERSPIGHMGLEQHANFQFGLINFLYETKGLFTPGHFMRFLWSDIYLIYLVKTFPFTLGHINVSLQNGYKSVLQFQRYMQI